MESWYESRIDRQIREAQERGEFDDLPGTGKPLPDRGELHDEYWWVKELVRRENLTGLLPATLKLRKDVEDLVARLAGEPSEAVVRRRVEEINDRIVRARRGHLDGPPVALDTFDVEEIVAQWRRVRSESAD